MTFAPGIAVVLMAVLGASFVSTGCWSRKAKAAPAPAVIALPPPPAPSKPEPLPAPPTVESGEPVSSLPASPIETPIEPPKPFEPPKPARPTPPRPVAQTPPAHPPAQEATPAEIPQLVPLLTPAEQERYNREIGDFIKRAEDNLARIGERKLDQGQRDNVLRVRTFILQAQDLRQSDLLTARSLAQRADVLAQDVASTLRR